MSNVGYLVIAYAVVGLSLAWYALALRRQRAALPPAGGEAQG